jgi:two-component system LytT family sensor kinase
MPRRLTFWLAVSAGWTLLVVVFAVSSSLTYALTYQPPRWQYTLTMAATEWYVWAALTPLITWLSWGVRNLGWWRLPIIAVAGVFIAFFKVTLTRVLRVAIGGDDNYFQITNLVIQYLIFCAIVLALRVWQHYLDGQQRELRTSQLEALLAQTRLQMLSMQLQPHFLFNTLNTIAELVHQQPAAAERMIGGLSHLLRETLHAGLVDRVPLSQELALLERYVDIQRARFGDRLNVTVTAEGDAGRALVPALLLQPLVENAIKHGIGAKAGAGHIAIAAARNGEQLLITIVDDGRGLPSGSLPAGIGLENSRARLQALYGDHAFELSIANRPSGGALVTIVLPWQTA